MRRCVTEYKGRNKSKLPCNKKGKINLKKKRNTAPI